jgi:hypothetical protein
MCWTKVERLSAIGAAYNRRGVPGTGYGITREIKGEEIKGDGGNKRGRFYLFHNLHRDL